MFGDKWYRSEEGKKSCAEKNSGVNHPNYNKKIDDLTKQKISETLKKNHTKELSDKYRLRNQKVIEDRKNGLLPPLKKRKYIIYTDDKIYYINGNYKTFLYEFKLSKVKKWKRIQIFNDIEIPENCIYY